MLQEESLWSESTSWSKTAELAQQLVAEKEFSAISCQAYSAGTSPVIHAGLQSSEQCNAIDDSSLYLVASLTKPVIASAVLCAVQQGLFGLNERICRYLPEWNRGEKRKITIRHLLCHTSGLPDQLPYNLELRNTGGTLEQFYQGTLMMDLVFPPGTQAAYQSMGFVVLQKLMEQITEMPLRKFVRQEIFEPLGMKNSYLGFAVDDPATEILDRVADVNLPEYLQGNSGDWNSSYWQRLGSPWGGMLSTPGDLIKFCKGMLIKNSVITPAIVQEATTNQLPFFESMNARDLIHRPWGLGWRLNWKSHRETFGDLLSENVIGHWGATGCMMWIDLEQDRACVICSTTPTPESTASLIRLSNSIHAATEEVERIRSD